jgi:hypothetical protein
MEETGKTSSAYLCAEDLGDGETLEVFGPKGRKEGAGRENVFDCVQRVSQRGVIRRRWRGSHNSVILGIEVTSHQIIEFFRVVPLVTSFGIGSPPRGSTACRWAIQVTVRNEAGWGRKGAGTEGNVVRMGAKTQ